MMPEHRCLEFGEEVIRYTVIRRDRKTLEIAVEPDCSVSLIAPLDCPVDAIEAKLRKRAPWVLRQQRYFSQFHPRVPARKYVAGETHLYLGRQHRLKVVLHIQQSVKLRRGELVVQTHHPLSPDVTQTMLEAWYRIRAQAKFAERIEVNLARFPDAERFRPKVLTVRSLRQRWGSLSPSGRLLLNGRLIQAPLDAIDYVITHELCHMDQPHHGAAFFALLRAVMPDWERRKARLERILA